MFMDTHPEVRRRWIGGFKALSERERLRMTLAMCDEIRGFAAAGARLRVRTDAEVEREEARALLGRDLADRVFARREERQ
jgi:hypothetical protein